MSKLNTTKYNAMVTNAAARVTISSTAFKDFIADVKAVVDANDDIRIALAASLTAHEADSVADSNGVHGLKVESGTWTPAFLGSGGTGASTYVKQQGKYYKINQLVVASFDIQLSAKDALLSGNIFIGGLPFNIQNANPTTFSQVHTENINLVAPENSISAQGAQNSPQISLVIQNNNSAFIVLQGSKINNTSRFVGTFTYHSV